MATTTKKAASGVYPTLPESLDLRFTSAEKFFAKKLSMTRADFDAIAAEAQVYAFTVARISSVQLIEDIRAEVMRAIIDGTTLEDFKKAMPGLMAKHGWSGTTPWHTETIFRTNIQTAYGLGQLESLREVAEDFPFWQYSAINDERTRPSHALLDGDVYPADHRFWREHFPPWGYNCRCDVIPLLPEQAAEHEIRTDDGPPPENFNGPGHAIEMLKNATPADVAQQVMPRLSPRATGALMRKLDIDTPLSLTAEGHGARFTLPGVRAELPDVPPPLEPLQGPTLAELEEAHAHNDQLTKIAKRKAQIKAAQQTYAAKKAAEKAAAKAAADKGAEIAVFKVRYPHLAAKLSEAEIRSVLNTPLEELVEAESLARKVARIDDLKKKYPNITKNLPDSVIDEHLLKLTPEELAAKELKFIRHKRLEEIKQKYPHMAKQIEAVTEESAKDFFFQLTDDQLKSMELVLSEIAEKKLKAEIAVAAAAEEAAAQAKAAADALAEKAISGKLSKAELAALTPEQKAARRTAQIARSRETAKAKAKGPRDIVAPPPAAPAVTGGDPLMRLSTLDYKRSGTHGVPLRRDRITLENHNLVVRMVEEKDGRQMYEFYGKAASDDLAKQALTQKDWQHGGRRPLSPSPQDSYVFRDGRGKLTPYHVEGQAEALGNDRVRTIATPQGAIEFRANVDRWYEDVVSGSREATTSRTFRIRIPRTGDDAIDFANFRRAVEGTPIEAVLEQTTAAEGKRIGIIRAIHEQIPALTSPGGVRATLRGTMQQVRATHLWAMNETELLEFARQNSITAQWDTIAARSVTEAGFSTYTIKRNFDYANTRIFHGTKGDGKYVANMIQKGSVQASYHRARAGYGGLTNADDRTGGSDSLFVRIFTKEGIEDRQFTSHEFSGNYQFVWKANELERLDVYAYNQDAYGHAYAHTGDRHSVDRMVAANKKRHTTSNELMFRYGINFENLDFIAANTEKMRQSLLAELRGRGILKINGRAIDDVVRVVKRMSQTFP